MVVWDDANLRHWTVGQPPHYAYMCGGDHVKHHTYVRKHRSWFARRSSETTTNSFRTPPKLWEGLMPPTSPRLSTVIGRETHNTSAIFGDDVSIRSKPQRTQSIVHQYRYRHRSTWHPSSARTWNIYDLCHSTRSVPQQRPSRMTMFFSRTA